MGAIRGVAEVVLNARDIQSLSEFYQDAMGFGFHSQFPQINPTIVFLTIVALDSPLGLAHPQTLALIDPARHPHARGKFDPPSKRSFSLNHLAFEIDEDQYESEIARLNTLGIETTRAKFGHARAKAIFFQDPEGNRLELICHDSSVSEHDAAIAAQETDLQIQRAINQNESNGS